MPGARVRDRVGEHLVWCEFSARLCRIHRERLRSPENHVQDASEEAVDVMPLILLRRKETHRRSRGSYCAEYHNETVVQGVVKEQRLCFDCRQLEQRSATVLMFVVESRGRPCVCRAKNNFVLGLLVAGGHGARLARKCPVCSGPLRRPLWVAGSTVLLDETARLFASCWMAAVVSPRTLGVPFQRCLVSRWENRWRCRGKGVVSVQVW